MQWTVTDDSDSPARNGRASWASSPGVRRSMQSNRGRNTIPELRVRSELHKAGLRYRTHVSPIPGLRCTVDVAFPRDRVAVFIDGCYWHSCPIHGSVPQSNRAWWTAKLNATRERDLTNSMALEEAGWIVVRVWEHEDVTDVLSQVQAALRKARAMGKGRT